MSNHQPSQFGDRIRDRRLGRALTVRALAEKSGVDPGTISRIENGVTEITLSSGIKLAEALGIELNELVPDSISDGRTIRDLASGYSVGLLVPKEIVDAFVDLHRRNEASAMNLLANWLNQIAQRQLELGIVDRTIGFDAQIVQWLLVRQDLFRFKIRLPRQCIGWVVPNIYALGGKIGRGDLKLYLAAISEDSQRYDNLGRQSKDILRRLQSETPNRLRLIDIVSLEEELGIDLVNMYWMVESEEGVRAARGNDHYKALLIALCVTICAWYAALGIEDGRWIEKLSEDIRSH
jgi:transcriptional regulator with XRE-family HTH domain